MKTLNASLLITALCLSAVLPAYADRDDRFDGYRERMQQQQERIERGVKSGELSRKEAKRLESRQLRIRMLSRQFREDGHLSRTERARLDKELEMLNREVKELKHNRVSRDRRPKYRYENERHDDGRHDHDRRNDDRRDHDRHGDDSRHDEPGRYRYGW